MPAATAAPQSLKVSLRGLALTAIAGIGLLALPHHNSRHPVGTLEAARAASATTNPPASAGPGRHDRALPPRARIRRVPARPTARPRVSARAVATRHAAVKVIKARPVPPMNTDPASNRALGYRLMLAHGWTADQWPALEALWFKESSWRSDAENPDGGAYGIPQALPASKLSDAGADWRTNPVTQIKWGLKYIADRYGDPSNAWAHEAADNWY